MNSRIKMGPAASGGLHGSAVATQMPTSCRHVAGPQAAAVAPARGRVNVAGSRNARGVSPLGQDCCAQTPLRSWQLGRGGDSATSCRASTAAGVIANNNNHTSDHTRYSNFSPETMGRQAVGLRFRLQRPTSSPPPQQQHQQLSPAIATATAAAGAAPAGTRIGAEARSVGAYRSREVGGGSGGGRVLAPAGSRQQQQRPQPATVSGSARAQDDLGQLRTGLALTWLGTNSGTPTLERNVSCTLVRLPGAVHMVDCGEGTHRQLMALRPLELSEVDGIFITHLHGDHCFGLGAALTLLDEAKAARWTDPARRRHHVYGPPGVAELLRATLVMTGLSRRLQLPLTITELVCSPASAHPPRPMEQQPQQQQPQQQPQRVRRSQQQQSGHSADATDVGGGGACGQILVQRLAARRVADAPELQAAVRAVGSRVAGLEEIWSPPRFQQYGRAAGRGSSSSSPYTDSEADNAQLYSSMDEDQDEMNSATGNSPRRQFVAAEGLFWDLPGCAGVKVRAAQLQHRLACWGYVFQEVQPFAEGLRQRKAVVLGDTVSSRGIAPLAAGCDVIAHEATFARGMEAKARIAQHSTGWMAGAFAAAVGARRLVLTHFSARYREGPRDLESQMRTSRITGQKELEQQSWAVAGLLREAAETYGRPSCIFAASDFYTFHVPLRAAATTAAAQAAAGGGDGEEVADGDGDGAAAVAAAGGEGAGRRLVRRFTR